MKRVVRLLALVPFVVAACAKSKPAVDPLASIKRACGEPIYAPAADAKTSLELVAQNRLPKASFGPLHVCVLVDDKPLISAADATANPIAPLTALHFASRVKEGRHVVRVLVETVGTGDVATYAWDTSSTHEVVAQIPVTAALTVYAKNADRATDMVAFEWKDDSVPIATGQVLETPSPGAAKDGGAP